MMYLWASYEKKMWKKESDPLVGDTNPGIRIRIRTKMSRIPDTASDTGESEGLQMVQRRILYLHKIRPNWLPKYEPPQT